MIAKEDENDNEVRREDQDRINQFARLNARLQENKSEREQIKVRRAIVLVEQNRIERVDIIQFIAIP